mmetsp:Transcript_130943/g.195090  ORF Transcript_130943/g.195090 Transcript_130943/m.195090 type:complete len:109 (-) Transcript_130943:109-435(-)
MSKSSDNSNSIAIPGREGEYMDISALSKTPGGSIYGTTPGGTRISYSYSELLFLKDFELSKTPPAGMATIPGITSAHNTPIEVATPTKPKEKKNEDAEPEDDTMFSMD